MNVAPDTFNIDLELYKKISGDINAWSQTT